ncbi:MAG TPA: glycosyltransferase family 2 protein [Candidatus Saccharimonadales bacterium]|nr:glycosyltransferase family 2 protein [Candidatus Saccharimonadales bacterium]
MRAERTKTKAIRRKRLALILPGHNEELILAATIQSAVIAGLSLKDIYVVDDNSSDRTREIALKLLPTQNVLTVARSGKAGAVMQAIKKFDIVKRYTWVHVADADSIFCPDYFRIYKKYLNTKKWSAAVGFVQSMPGNWIATYRSFSYTYGQHIFRRLQSWAGMISVLPGPVTCFKTDILKNLDFSAESLTEDFDLTLQIHRKKLGRIRFIPEAINYTQDPRTLSDFINQTLRWQRGFFQGLRKYNIGLRPHMIDAGVGYQMIESIFYLFQMIFIFPLLLVASQSWASVLALLAADYAAIIVLAVFSAFAARRPAILLSLPYFYVLRLIELGVFIRAFVEVIILRRFQTVSHGWKTEGRRYEIDASDLRSMQ